MSYDFGRGVSFHELVELVPIHGFSSTALVKPFEEDKCSCADKAGNTSLIEGHPIVGYVTSYFCAEGFP